MKTTLLACDFCGKTQAEVKHLVRGPSDVCICDECIAISAGIVAEAAHAKTDTPAAG